jgi:hypothetical protein
MITLETEGTSGEVDLEFAKTGIKPAGGRRLKQWTKAEGMGEVGVESCREHYVSLKDCTGILIRLASILYTEPKVASGKSSKTILPQKQIVNREQQATNSKHTILPVGNFSSLGKEIQG